MSASWLLWIILSSLTGSPVMAALVVLAVVLVADRYTVGILPSPFRAVGRWQRASKLQRLLQANPHDRRARYELADLWVQRKRYAAAVEVLKPNLEAGDDDVGTLFLLGVAYLGAGDAARGELLLDEAAKLEPGYQMGAVDLERGRFRLARGDVKGAIEALERLRGTRQGTVEGRVLLARALDGSGRDADAALMREEAWKEYVVAPGFQRRRERLWAWRARPSRPLAYGAMLVVGLALGISLLSRVTAPEPSPDGYGYYGDDPGMAADSE
ncbi:tetratricopeptide repeat protein [Archangium lansingense]|uniref:Tetratricopeptide repeat protein n=1 Tax=Archangium lansingense TaxID=2995310 RepID=A0ABT3ZZ95_9BACT|nr:tetratricopeptide repeat protein [Archangium lansinium]MCY1074730.1 tetratricopeptide repeat protein [Archangium lansinium]